MAKLYKALRGQVPVKGILKANCKKGWRGERGRRGRQEGGYGLCSRVHRAPLVAEMWYDTTPNKLGSQSLVLLHTQGEMQGLRDEEDSGPSERRHGRACKVPCDL